jgi:hydroxysqualene dehydroxylase
MALVNPDVVVLGAGFAGLSAAVKVAGHGARVLVLEARGRLGGRATAFPDRETGELVDNGQHVLFGCYTETLDFLKSIGALDNVRIAPNLSVTMIDRAGKRSTLVSTPALPPPFHLLGGIFEWDALSLRDKLSALAMRTPIKLAQRELLPGATRRAASDGETVENFLIRNGQTARLREMLWDPLAIAALNQAPTEAAAPPFARVLGEMFGKGERAAALVLPTKPLHLMYAEPARAAIEQRGGAVRTGAPAKVRFVDGGVTVEADGERWTPAIVVSAVPWFAFPDLFDDVPAALVPIVDRARRMASCPIVTVNLWFDRRIIDEPLLGLPGRAMQWVFDKRLVFGGEASHLSLVSSGAKDVVNRTNEGLIRLAEQEINEALPETRLARVVRATVVREPRATFSLAPGQPARPGAETGIRSFYLAGDWTDTGLPATIEGAVRSGHKAATLLSRM